MGVCELDCRFAVDALFWQVVIVSDGYNVCGAMQHGACVNVADLWKFTPLHEAAAKGKFEICRLLLKVSMEVGCCGDWLLYI